MSDPTLRPTRFDYDDDARALVVEWSDGARLPIGFERLRLGCRCAVCRGEMGRPGRFDLEPSLRPGEDELADIHLVGSYGLGARWADGHATGIYTYEHLRALGEEAARPAQPG